MALISKSDLAGTLGVDASDISDSVYDWAKNEFFLITDLREAEEEKTYRKFIISPTHFIKLPDVNIKSIDDIKRDGESLNNLTQHVNLKFNPDTGTVWYSGGFGGSGRHTSGDGEFIGCRKPLGGFANGTLIEVTYTINAYTHTRVHDYLLSLLVAKSLALFTPDKVQQVKSVKIGNYRKEFGSASSNLGQYKNTLDMEIERVIDIIQGNDGKLTLGQVL